MDMLSNKYGNKSIHLVYGFFIIMNYNNIIIIYYRFIIL